MFLKDPLEMKSTNFNCNNTTHLYQYMFIVIHDVVVNRDVKTVSYLYISKV